MEGRFFSAFNDTDMQNTKILLSSDVYVENDKTFAPFLLACSYNGLIKFEGSHVEGRVLYYHFSPKQKAIELIEQFQSKTTPPIPPKDVFEAWDVFWRQVEKTRDAVNGGINYGAKRR